MTRLRAVVGALFTVWLAGACGDDRPPPGYGPGAGYVGAPCRVSMDCASGYCCMSPRCGGGMCTYGCGNDAQCPAGTRCADGACFWACSSNANCGPGQSCEHGQTVCQY